MMIEQVPFGYCIEVMKPKKDGKGKNTFYSDGIANLDVSNNICYPSYDMWAVNMIPPSYLLVSDQLVHIIDSFDDMLYRYIKCKL